MKKYNKDIVATPATRKAKPGEIITPRKEGQQRYDGWENLVTLMGTGADKRTHSKLNWDLRPPEFYEQLYSGGGIPARIVDLIPEECLRNGWDWLNKDIKEKKALNKRCKELDLRGAFIKAWKWGRAYGGGLLHIVTDTVDPSAPLQKGEKVLALRDLSRWDVRIVTTDIEYDFGSSNFGYPRIYYLNVQMGSQYKGYPIHWTRMIRFDGQLVPRRTFIRNNYWHDSILNRIYNSIRNYETSNDSAAVALQDFNVDVYKLQNVAAMMGAGKEQIIRDRIEMMNYTKSLINAMILDTKDEEYENKGRSLEGVAELLVHQGNRLVAETDIPHTKLLGESPTGSNATGNSTSQEWYNVLGSSQENDARPKLERLFQIIFALEDDEELEFKFRPVRVLDDVEQSNLRKTNAETDTAYINSGVLDPSEVASSRFGGAEYSSETTLDKESREAGVFDLGADDEEGDEDDDGKGNAGGGSKESKGGNKKEPGASDDTDKGNKQKKGSSKADLTGKNKEALDSETEVSMTSEMPGTGESEFEPRNKTIENKGSVPKTKSFIGQTESLPMRNPKTDPLMKGPGIPNKARSYLPTRGNGITAKSGFDFEKDAGSHGESREGASTQVEPRKTEDTAELLTIDMSKKLAALKARRTDSDDPDRAASIIVHKGGKFLMGKRRDSGKWSLPGGHIKNDESHHQGAIRELMEETGLPANKLKFIGGRVVEHQQGKSVYLNMYEHHADDDAKPTWKMDPDNEFGAFKWFDSTKELPEDVRNNLAHPNNIALVHLGVLK